MPLTKLKNAGLIILIFWFCNRIYCAQNAGVLPFAVANNKLYFLLGLERRYSKTQKLSYWTWTDFGGKCDSTDATDAPHYGTDQATFCGAREAAEETRHVFGNVDLAPLNQSLSQRSDVLKKTLNYWIDAITKTNKKFTIPSYDEFLAKVDYIDTNLINDSYRRDHAEKWYYKWFDLDIVLNAIKQKPSLLPLSNSEINTIYNAIKNTKTSKAKASKITQYANEFRALTQPNSLYETLANTLSTNLSAVQQTIQQIQKELQQQKMTTVAILPFSEVNGKKEFLMVSQNGGYSGFEFPAPMPVNYNAVTQQLAQALGIDLQVETLIENKAQNYELLFAKIQHRSINYFQQKGITSATWIPEDALAQLLTSSSNTIKFNGQTIILAQNIADTLRMPQAAEYIKLVIASPIDNLRNQLLQLQQSLSDLQMKLQQM